MANHLYVPCSRVLHIMLANDDVHVWWMPTTRVEPRDLNRWLDLLDEEERARAGRFWRDSDRCEFIAAHALLRTMLARHGGRPARAWRFTVGHHGKPEIAPGNDTRLEFNIAHTHGLVVAAVGFRGRIGVDAERIDPTKSVFAVAETVFTATELELLRQESETQVPGWFFRLWTLKEAYIKAVGTGLSAPLQSFAFSFDPIRIAFAADIVDSADNWQFALLATTNEHVVGLAADHPSGVVRNFLPRAITPSEI
jgi:4'-phosphopantetheinyl transferase